MIINNHTMKEIFTNMMMKQKNIKDMKMENHPLEILVFMQGLIFLVK